MSELDSKKLVVQRVSQIKKQLAYKTIDEKYTIEKEMGRGGIGIIYHVVDKELKRDLAMKVLIPKNLKDEEEIAHIAEHFIEEARITAQLEHPNIVPVHDIGLTKENDVFFTMKTVQGQELSEILENIKQKAPGYSKKYTLHNLLMIFRKVCDAIAFSHARSIVHRDIKPENIMIGHFGEVILMDWGLTKYVGSKEKNSPPSSSSASSLSTQRIHADFNKTVDSCIKGTPAYMSPEQVGGDRGPIDQLSDIYLLGATLYHMITLYAPHSGNTLHQILYNITKNKVIPPQERSAQLLPDELCRITMKAMAFKRKDRYQMVEKLCEDIDAFMSGQMTITPRLFKKGEFLMKQGDIGSEVYVLINGQVDVSRKVDDKDVHISTMEMGDIVGEMAAITSKERSANVVAAEDSEVLVINDNQIKTVFKRVPSWMEKLVVKVIERLRMANNRIHPLLVNIPDHHILKALAALSMLKMTSQKAANIEEVVISVDAMAQEIADFLCISNKTTRKVLENLQQAQELCLPVAENTFRFANFALLQKVIEFVGQVITKKKVLDTPEDIRKLALAVVPKIKSKL